MTRNVLEEICLRKTKHVEIQKGNMSLTDLKTRLRNSESPRGFINALKRKGAPALIAEVKKASPSKGLIRADFNPAEIAQSYERAGAACISVLTDEPYFRGTDEYFTQVKNAVALPMLRKDFMIDPYQIYESRVLGADCILLIMAALDDDLVEELYSLSKELGMDVLFEIHDQEELDRALKLTPEMVGVNARNLKTLNVDIQTTHDLSTQIPDTCLKVAESGIGDYNTVKDLQDNGYTAFLVGESLMRQNDIESAVHTLLNTSAA